MDKSTSKLVQENVLLAIEAIRKNIERAIRKETIIDLSQNMIRLCEEYKSLKTFELKEEYIENITKNECN